MNWQERRVFITGISGFVGSYLAERLVKEGAKVYGLIRRRSDGAKPKNLVEKDILDKITLFEGDVTNTTSIANALDL